MSKLFSNGLIIITIILFVLFSLLYGNNQFLPNDATEMFKNGFNALYNRHIADLVNLNFPTLVILLPLQVIDNAYSPLISLIIIKLIAGLLFISGLKPYLKSNTIVWFVILYFLSPWLLYLSHFSYVSYLDLGVALFFKATSVLAQRQTTPGVRTIWTIVMLLGIAWCVQFHHAWTILAFTTAFLLLFRIIKITLLGFFCGLLAAGGLTYLFAIAVSNDIYSYLERLFSDSYFGYGLVHVYPVLKSVLYWVRFSSTLVQNDLLIKADFAWMTSSEVVEQGIRYLWLGITYIVGACSLFFSLCSNYLVIRNAPSIINLQPKTNQPHYFLPGISIAMLLGVIIYASLAPYLLKSSDLILCFGVSLIPIMLVIDKYHLTDSKKHYIWLISIIGFLAIANLMGAVSSNDYNRENNLYQQVTNMKNELFNE